MAYDEGLAQRLRDILVDQPDLVEKKMFGGIAFMLQGNMACGSIKRISSCGSTQPSMKLL
jgi:hypothetical protein